MKGIVVKPTHFKVDTRLAKYLPELPIDKKKLYKQYDQFCKTLSNFGIDLIEINQRPELYSMVYCRDWGFVKDNVFYQGRIRNKYRTEEQNMAGKKFFEKGVEGRKTKHKMFIDGSNYIENNGNIYFGWGKRAAIKSLYFLEKHIGEGIIDFKITNEKFNTLDMCVGPLDDTSALYYMEGMNMVEQAKVCYHFSNPIPINEEDAEIYATSFIHLGEKILLSKGVSEYLKTKVRAAGHDFLELDISEYLKGGQGLRSLCLIY